MSKVALKTSRQGTISLYLQTSKMYHSALPTNIDILFSRVGKFTLIEFKDNLTVTTIWNTGETGDTYYRTSG